MSDTTPHRYTAELAQQIELAWQDRWEEAGHLPRPQPRRAVGRAREGRRPREAARPRHVPLPQRCRPARRPPAGLHRHRRLRALPPDDGQERPALPGLRRVRAAGRAVRRADRPAPAQDDRGQHGRHEAPAAPAGAGPRRPAQHRDHRPGLLPLDPVDLHPRSTTPGTTRRPSRPDGGLGRARPIAELVEEFVGSRPAARRRAAAPGQTCPRSSRPTSSTASAWPTPPRRRSTGRPGWAPCCPTRRSPTTGAPSAATSRSSRRNLRQWMMRITAYADRLADDLDRVDWPEKVKLMQRNWIGRSQGARVRFPVVGARTRRSRSSRPDPTRCSARRSWSLAPEHPLLDVIVSDGPWPEGTNPAWTGGEADPRSAVAAYRLAASRKSEVERQTEGRDKTGVFTGAFATNPVNGAADPGLRRRLRAHGLRHRRDHGRAGAGRSATGSIAERFGLPIVRTVQPPEGHPDDEPFTGEGPAINSANDEVSLDGLGVAEAKARIIEWLAAKGFGDGDRQLQAARLAVQPPALLGRAVPHRLRRGRREPRRARLDAAGGAARRARLLAQDLRPRRRRQLSRSRRWAGSTEWVEVELDLGDGRGVRSYRRETNTMPNWAGSCWYYLRYLDPANAEAFVDPENERYWMGPQAQPSRARPTASPTPAASTSTSAASSTPCCTCSTRGSGTRCCTTWATSRSEEPFRKYFSQGYIQAYAYRDARGQPVEASEVVEVPDPTAASRRYTWQGQPVTREYGKIGKSLKNVVSPDEMFERLRRRHLAGLRDVDGAAGAEQAVGDARRRGRQRFLQRLWRNVDRRGDRRGAGRRRAAGRGDATGAAPDHRRRVARTTRRWGSTPPSPGSSS